MNNEQMITAELPAQIDGKPIVVCSYIPQSGDLFKWCDEDYWCISSGRYSGVVNPVGETYYQRGFIWNYGGEIPVFIRKGNSQELERLGVLV